MMPAMVRVTAEMTSCASLVRQSREVTLPAWSLPIAARELPLA